MILCIFHVNKKCKKKYMSYSFISFLRFEIEFYDPVNIRVITNEMRSAVAELVEH